MSKSILHVKDGTCYLCEALHGDLGYYPWLEEHHVFEGTANRKKSEHWGLKIYLCNEHHNQTGRESVHNNKTIEELVKKVAQKEFEKKHGHKKFMDEFGKNWLEEDQWFEPEITLPEKKPTLQELAKRRPENLNFVTDDSCDLQLFNNDGQLSFF